MPRLTTLGFIVVALPLLESAVAPVGAQRAAAGPGFGLGSLFDPATGVVRDTNVDEVPDAIAARVIVPASPSVEDVEAAINIAGRLGFETSAATLPVVLRDDQVESPGSVALPILVGRDNRFTQALLDRKSISLEGLTPGQGLVAAVPAPLGGPDGLVVIGADHEGTLAAGIEVAARLPRLWSTSGITVPGIEDQARAYLRSKGIATQSARVVSLVVDAERRGVARVDLRVEVSGKAGQAVAALESLDLAHRRGLEPRMLNFANVATTAIEIVVAGRSAGRAEVRRSGLNARTLTPPIDPDELATDSPGERGRPAEQPSAPARPFDLASAYSIDGWFGDGYADLIPDRTDTSIIVGPGGESIGAAHIAARLGLESTGLTLPIVKTDRSVREPEREASPILAGRSNSHVQALVKVGKVRLTDLEPGDGVIEIVPRAFGNATATVVAGADAAGHEAASLYLARRVPLVWDLTRGAPALADLAAEAGRFFQARTGAGQASQAVVEIESLAAELADKPVESVDVKLFLERASAELDRHVTSRLSDLFKGAAITVASQGITDPVPVFEDTLEIPWEVDELRSKVRAEVIPRVRAGSDVEIEARVSEPPELRRQIADEIRADVERAGARAPRVRVLSAYKQGFLWMTEQVIPELRGKGARSIHVRVASVKPDLSKKYKFYEVPTRWIHELYPVDEIVQRDLAIPREAFTLELVDDAKETYALEAFDGSGRVVHRASFSPKTVEREYLEKFPGWSRVTVTTGWIAARVDGQSIVDARIATDPERFWDHYQTNVLARIHDHVMKVTEGRPMPDKQPFHRDLDIEIRMSEPDFRIGLDEELVSSLESLHEDLYFVTLDFFDALGRTTTRRRLAAPGKIFPVIHPSRTGRPGQARVLYAGNASTRARLEVAYTLKDGGKPTRVTRDLARIEVGTPAVARAVVRSERVREFELRIEAEHDRAAARAADSLDALVRLHGAGLYRDVLSYEHVDRLAIAIASKEARTRRVVPHTGEWPATNVRRAAATPAEPSRPAGRGAGSRPGPVVTWDHVISPDESEAIVARLGAYPAIRAYRAGSSYRGRDVSVMEITRPTASELVSRAKLTTWKPTILITGRQHANEVSSTSHILRLAELLATDPAYERLLGRVNVILHPVENPDGAAMAYELQKLTPTHMLHAGRYSALGMDVGSQVGQPDPLLPESLVRGRMWREWLPDIYLNPHGYPSHEWVQQFAGYVPPGFRAYWSSRGWYTSVGGLRDPRFPGHAEAVEAIREAIVREINSNADVRAMNLRHQARYRKWAFGFQPYVYNQEIYKDTAIYWSDPETGEPGGSRRAPLGRVGDGGSGRASMNAWPQVTYFNGGTESPDETAQGDWLALVTKPGFSYLMAAIGYLYDGRFEVQRIEEGGQRDAVTLTLLRVRPVMPGRAREPTATNGRD